MPRACSAAGGRQAVRGSAPQFRLKAADQPTRSRRCPSGQSEQPLVAPRERSNAADHSTPTRACSAPRARSGGWSNVFSNRELTQTRGFTGTCPQIAVLAVGPETPLVGPETRCSDPRGLPRGQVQGPCGQVRGPRGGPFHGEVHATQRHHHGSSQERGTLRLQPAAWPYRRDPEWARSPAAGGRPWPPCDSTTHRTTSCSDRAGRMAPSDAGNALLCPAR